MGDNGSYAERWRELSGENNWEGLLDPLDLDLRKYILLHGDLAGTVVSAINDEKVSKFYGYSRYAKEDMFSKVGLDEEVVAMYEVSKLIYATSNLVQPEPQVDGAEDPNSTFMGFVAVSTDAGTAKLGRRDILIVWRGTVTEAELQIDEKFLQTSAVPIFGDAHIPVGVHRGWYSYYTSKSDDPRSTYTSKSARVQVYEEIMSLMKLYEKELEMSITLGGHSMGSAMATINAMDIANGYHGLDPPLPSARKDCLISAFVTASPRVGDRGFKNVFDGLNNLHLLRISNLNDPIPKLPLEIPFPFYIHVGQELPINTQLSHYLKNKSISLDHQLEIYLHGVAGTQGPFSTFKLEVDRDLALANKFLDAVKDEYLHPISWWIRQNKGMVQQDDSSWELVEDHESQPQ